jgi:hypothetical protein
MAVRMIDRLGRRLAVYWQGASWQSRLTLLVGVVGLAILLLPRSDNSAVLLFGRYSPRYLVTVAGYMVVMGVGAVSLSAPLPCPSPALSWLLIVAAMAVVAWLPLLDHTWWLNATFKLTFGWLIIALVTRLRPALTERALWGLGVLVLIINLLTIPDYPRLHTIDEGWTASFGLTFYQDGLYYARVNQGIYGIPQRYVPLMNVLPGYWMAALGVGLWQGRLMMTFGGLLLLAVTYRVALRWYGNRQVALMAAVLLACCSLFVRASHTMRMDIFLALGAMTALWLFLGSEEQPRRAYFAGVVLAGAVEAHQNAALLCAAGGAVVAAMIVTRSVRSHRVAVRRHELALALGVLTALALYLAIHVLPDSGASVRQFWNQVSLRVDGLPEYGVSTLPLGETLRRISDLSRVALPETLLLGAAATLGLWFRRTRPLVALLWAVLAFYRLTTSSDVLVNYAIQFLPLAALIGAGLLAEVNRASNGYAVTFALCAAVAAPMTVSAVDHALAGRNRQFVALSQQIAATIAPTEKVVALSAYTFAMPAHRHLMIPFLHDYAVIARSPVRGVAVWEGIAPDVFIVSTALGEPLDTPAKTYRDQHGFVEVERYDGPLGCCVLIYRRTLR